MNRQGVVALGWSSIKFGVGIGGDRRQVRKVGRHVDIHVNGALDRVLDIKIDAASVDTGSGMKDDKLKSKDFFNVKDDAHITFQSAKIVQTGPHAFELDGNFTIRGMTKPERLELKVSGAGTGSGTIQGTMAFDRKDYGMDSGIPC